MYRLIAAYVCFAFAWGIYTIYRHEEQNPKNSPKWKLWLVFILNFLLFPIAVVWSAINGKII